MDSFTEVSHEGWFSRIKNAIVGVLFGILLFVIAFPVLFLNEGRAVKRSKAIEFGAASLETVSADKVDPGKEGGYVHITATADSSETLTDPKLGISAEKALRLQRKVEMYQWKENKRTETKKKLGGGTEKVTKYDYSKEWSDGLIKSESFRHKDGHQNPGSMPYASTGFSAKKVTLGAFTLNANQVSRIDSYKQRAVTEADKAALPADVVAKVKLSGSGLYIGSDPGSPAIGDARITYQVVSPTTISIAAKQVGSSFAPFTTPTGDLDTLKVGSFTKDQLMEAEKEANNMMTWILRGVGFFMMVLGVFLVLNPLKVLADVIPFIGSIVGGGLFLVALLVAAAGSSVTIALGWVAYRPLIGIPLLLLGLGSIAAVIFIMVSKKSAEA
jgi:hypothetical protein